jgi:adenylate cyclase
MCGSVRLYEEVGDAEGHRLAAACMAVLVDLTRAHGGTLIRTQGDGVMSTFPDPATAMQAARAMQQAHRHGPVQIKIGFHCGPVIRSEADVYGDAVNLAARVIGLARAGESLTTRDTVAQLPGELQAETRLLDRTPIKGKREPVTIYALMDDEDTQATQFASQWNSDGRAAGQVLWLQYRGTRLALHEGEPPLVLGRSQRCQLVVDSDFASREHAQVEPRRNHFLLHDQSTNGTYLETESGLVFIKRETVQLFGSGRISLGVRPGPDRPEGIHFSHTGQ